MYTCATLLSLSLLCLALPYAQIRSLAVPATLLSFVATGVFRGFKDTRTPLAGTAASVAVSLGMHLLLINGEAEASKDARLLYRPQVHAALLATAMLPHLWPSHPDAQTIPLRHYAKS